MSIGKIDFFLRPSPASLPPCISQLLAARSAGWEVDVHTVFIEPQTRGLLEAHGITVYATQGKRPHGKLQELFALLRYRRQIRKACKGSTATLRWVASADTARYCGDLLCMGDAPFLLNLWELYDRFPHILKRIAPMARRAERVIVPQYHRAHILKCWLQLPRLPEVIPNIPVLPKELPHSDTAEAHKKTLAALSEPNILLYQGWIAEDRDITTFAAAVEELPDWRLVAMGPVLGGDATLDRLQKRYPGLCYLSYVEPPAHLQITALATAGIATYDDSSLNNLFCAPNKIYEYAACGVPILARDIPGLSDPVGTAGMGVCVDTASVAQIKEALGRLRRERAAFAKAQAEYLATHSVQEKIASLLSDFAKNA